MVNSVWRQVPVVSGHWRGVAVERVSQVVPSDCLHSCMSEIRRLIGRFLCHVKVWNLNLPDTFSAAAPLCRVIGTSN